MLFFSFWLPWQPELWLEFNLLNNFGRASPKQHPCKVSSRLAQWFRRRRCLKKLWTTHDGHWAITKAYHEHFVLRWANKRAMMALDHPSQSISPQNEFDLIFWSIEQKLRAHLLLNWQENWLNKHKSRVSRVPKRYCFNLSYWPSLWRKVTKIRQHPSHQSKHSD